MGESEVPPGESKPQSKWALIRSEDWLAVLLGGLILGVALGATYFGRAKDFDSKVADYEQTRTARVALAGDQAATKEQVKETEKKLESLLASLHVNPLKSYFAKVGSWKDDPRDAFVRNKKPIHLGLAGTLLVSLMVFALGIGLSGESPLRFAGAFVVVFLLAE